MRSPLTDYWYLLALALCLCSCTPKPRAVDREALWTVEQWHRASAAMPEHDALEEIR